MEKPKLMIVEDEYLVATELKNRLMEMGYIICAQAGSGEEAVVRAGEERPDLILMDIYLRGRIDGIEAADEIFRRLGIPVIFLTAYADADLLKRAKAVQPYGYVLKPYTAYELRAVVEMALYKAGLEKELRRREEIFRDLFQGAPLPYQCLDEEGRLVEVNRAWLKVMGYSMEEVIDREFEEFLSPDHREAFKGNFRKFMESGEICGACYEIIRQDGAACLMEFFGEVSYDGQGRFKQTHCLLNDITERRRIEAEREGLIVELQEALAEVKRLSGLLPICASCKKIRDDQGYWQQVEKYVQEHSEARFSHSICPDCAKKLYPDLFPDL